MQSHAEQFCDMCYYFFHQTIYTLMLLAKTDLSHFLSFVVFITLSILQFSNQIR